MRMMPKTGLAAVMAVGLGLAACGGAPDTAVAQGDAASLSATSGGDAAVQPIPGAAVGRSQVRLQLLRATLPAEQELVGEEAPAHLLLDGAG